jgi:hypothetical protein
MQPDKPPHPWRVHEGVRIYRVKEVILGTDFRFNKEDKGVPCKPKYEITYRYAGSYPYSTLEECKQGIDNVKTFTLKNDIPDEVFREVMNTEGDLKCR